MFVCFSNKKYSIVIIGSGPTGLGAAQRLYELSEQFPDISVTILEQHDKPGGLASSERDDQDFLWDMGGHVVFSHYQYFDDTLDRAINNWNRRERASYAFMKGSDGIRRFIPYPVQSNIEVMDKVDQQKCLSGLEDVVANAVKDKPANFDQWLVRNFGVGLCEVFMRKYNRKVWTVDPSEMNSVWVGERVAVPNITAIKLKISGYDNGNLVKESAWGPNHFFRFPKYKGTGGIWQAVADSLPREWFKFRHKVVGLDIDTNSVMIESGTWKKSIHELKFDTLISTIPLDMLVNMITGRNGSPEEMKEMTSHLLYSHTHVIGIGLTGQPPQVLLNKSWMYFPDSDSPFYRITVFSSYSDDHVPEPGKQWSLMCEAAEPKHNPNLEYWTKENLITATIQALRVYRFITPDMVVSKYHRRLDHGYPIPSINREVILDKVQPWLESKDIYSRGRFGGWRYEVSNQDHSFMQGVEVTDKLLRGIPEETYFDPNIVNSRRNTGRKFSERLNDYEFVIAHYNESLDWIRPIVNHTHVYHKGKDLQPPPLHLYAWERLPNVGRESHTYLYHIIKNYEKLPEITVFLQGDSSHLHGEYIKNPMEYVYNIKKNINCAVGISRLASWGRIKHLEKWRNFIRSGAMRIAKFTVGRFFQKLFGFKHPRYVHWCPGACFATTREIIQKHPKDFYIKAISYVDNHRNPEEGHYFERLWSTIFS
ncbi:hypothetical protein OS493_028637 [Desmophyllum pertusum]|uniref:Amine oxidase domain-containing protein n=1 Tax=Desmophyllum pertusum TaxID=174260 RepID=A0A9W9YLQ4_9CNID|nr:hypothetical protein OS493_028637 [Desmophyllum pertusum]